MKTAEKQYFPLQLKNSNFIFKVGNKKTKIFHFEKILSFSAVLR